MLLKDGKMSRLPTAYQDIIHLSRYARYLDDKGRRETWEETTRRFVDYMVTKFPFLDEEGPEFQESLASEVYNSILNLEVMPSMRLLMTSGEAVEKDNICAYNCAYVAINNKRAFSEALYILLNGTGVGFSCERQEVAKLPAIPSELKETGDVIVVADSKLGWAKAYKKLLSSLWEGDLPSFDFSKVRPAGSRLKTFG